MEKKLIINSFHIAESLERIVTALKLRNDDERAKSFLVQFNQPSIIERILHSNVMKRISDTCESWSVKIGVCPYNQIE